MNQQAAVDVVQDAGAAGFRVPGAIIRIGDEQFGLIIAPKAVGDHDDVVWNGSRKRVDGALSFFDGLANTKAMAAAGSKLGQWARDLRTGGFDDWYIPSRDELELLYRHLKPGAGDNYVWRNGDNPSSVPPGYPYTEAVPTQTQISAFHTEGDEAFEETWYWSSTQCAGDPEWAWSQHFGNGTQSIHRKYDKLRARAVRRVPIR